ncbi:hypothetical protein H1R20_g11858, partial [Candolleomyces eurysporus]
MAPNTRQSARNGTAEPNTVLAGDAIDAEPQGAPSLSGKDSPLTDVSGDKETVDILPDPQIIPPASPPNKSDLSSSDYESSSGSDSDDCIAQTIPMGNSDIATITISRHGKRPSVSSGTLTPAVLLEFTQYCRSYFDEKDIPEDGPSGNEGDPFFSQHFI